MSARQVITTHRRLAGVGAVCGALLFAGGCGVVAQTGADGGSGSDGPYVVRAIFDSAQFLQTGLDVKTSGVPIGKVTDIELTKDFPPRAAVTFDVTERGFQDFRQDATCTIRPSALIGERYLSCETTQQRADGATAPPPLPVIQDGPDAGERLLPLEQTAVPVDPDEFLDFNTMDVRQRFGVIVRELGAGVAGRGDKIEEALTRGNSALREGSRVLRQMSEQRDMLRRLVSTSDQVLDSLSRERGSLRGTIRNGAEVGQRIAARQAEVRASIRELANLMEEIDPTVTRANELLDALEPITADLNRSADDLSTILNLLPTVSERGSAAVTAVGPTLDRGREILTSAPTTRLIDRITTTSQTVSPVASTFGLTAGDFRSTGGLDYFFDAIFGLSYATNGRDANGYTLRGATVNIANCAIPRNVVSDGCGARLYNEANVGAAARAVQATPTPPSGTAARAQGTTKTPAPRVTATPKASPKASPSAPVRTTATDAERTAASLVLGGGR